MYVRVVENSKRLQRDWLEVFQEVLGCGEGGDTCEMNLVVSKPEFFRRNKLTKQSQMMHIKAPKA